MSRSGYVDDYDCEHFALYRGTVDRAIAGQRGQAFLRDLVSALETMPVKQLAADVLVSDAGVCAMGAVAVRRGVSASTLQQVDEYDPRDVGHLFDIAPQLAAEIAFENDGESGPAMTDAERYDRMLDWARRNLEVRPRAPRPRGRCSWCCREFVLRRGTVGWHRHNRVTCDGVGKPPVERPS